MATGTILCPIQAATPTDDSTSNKTPALLVTKGTDTAPAKFFLTADFDAAQDEHLWWNFRMPANWASGFTVKLQWIANATSGTARWGVKVGAITASDADTPTEHAPGAATTVGTATNATEAYRLNETSIDCSAALDSLAAGDLVFLLIYRDGDGTSGTDDLAVDAKLITAAVEYTTT